MPSPKVLIILTSQAEIPANRAETGWYLPELAHPYQILKPKVDISIASPQGGEAPLDPHSVKAFENDEVSMSFMQNEKAVWANTYKIAEVIPMAGEFDALFYVGGHGPMFDLPSDPRSLALIQSFAAARKPIAAVCHGPAALLNATTPSGLPLLSGATVTGFSNGEEDQVGMSAFMPFLLETELNRISGGMYVKEHPYKEKVVVSKTAGMEGPLITGQNPRSAARVANEILKALGLDRQ
ncbi:hypothetical protein ASPWEDRAFT_114189 [Aspergillus wentii DTO 134E9]|uniref:D-lactate dehydratase n=1 Tax=Aspergillus wentii DTO 134E9 TaxID=1073089 RepID=A0A1L9RGA5_ASPWE|nr:uncharacterized protein ASPWEDRAFT_114189 [Aspergillus wentii DTO 134E9]OJJ33962.1 hypothetical protein ASPWEDRAFT_114189 [Aspergillus wentii DTO 134E9]